MNEERAQRAARRSLEVGERLHELRTLLVQLRAGASLTAKDVSLAEQRAGESATAAQMVDAHLHDAEQRAADAHRAAAAAERAVGRSRAAAAHDRAGDRDQARADEGRGAMSRGN